MSQINNNIQKGLSNMTILRRTRTYWLIVLLIVAGAIWADFQGQQTFAQATTGDGLLGEYYDGTGFNIFRYDQIDPTINFTWGGGSPNSGLLGNDDYSIRWTGYLLPSTTETYQFCTQSDDGVRLWIDDNLIINNWTTHSSRRNCGSYTLQQDVPVAIRLDYYERGGTTIITLRWSTPTISEQIIPQAVLYSEYDILDSDEDGISNTNEESGDLNTAYNNETTLPNNPDTDSDGWTDGQEILEFGTNPNVADTDGDTILDGSDNCPLAHNSNQGDHDSDGLGDACEAGPVYPPNTTISVDQTTASADGVDVITLTVTVRDASNDTMDNIPVNILSTSNNPVIATASGASDANGVFQTTITSEVAEPVVLTIEVGDAANSFIGDETFLQAITFIGPDMAVNVTALPSIIAGQTLIYIVDVENLGTLPVSDVNVFAGVPLGTATIDSVVTPAGVTLDQQGINSVSWLIPSINANSSYQFLVYARSAANLQLDNQVPLDAIVDAANDHDPNNNSASGSTRIEIAHAPSGLTQEEKITVVYDSPTSAAAIGDTITLTIDVTNTTLDETLYNVEGFAALKDTFVQQFQAASILTFTWPDPDEPGTLLPGETATASFDYTVTANYPNLSDGVRTVRISADDADPTDGLTYVTGYDVFTLGSLIGPGTEVQIIADRSSALTGETVNFTVRVLNNAAYSDSISNLVVTDLLNGQVLTLSSTNPVAPGETVTADFSYVVQESDTPLLSAIVTVEGLGTSSGAVVAETVQRDVTVISQLVSPVDLDLQRNSDQAVLFTNIPFDLPLRLFNNGTAAAQDTEISVTLPLDVQVIDAATGTYDAATRTLTWDLTTLPIGTTENVTPQLQTTANIGETLSLNVSASNSLGDSNYTNNTLTVILPIVEPVATSAALIPVDRNWLVGDGVDSIDYIVTLSDQLGRPVDAYSGLMASNGGSLTFANPNILTDVNGQATISVMSSAPGADIAYADFGMGVTTSTSIQIRPNSLVLVPNANIFGVGGTGTIDLTLTNTSEQGDSFTFGVTGLEALDTAWINFSPEPLLLNSGQFSTSRLSVDVPFTVNNCSTLPGTYPITVTAYDSQSNVVDTATETLVIQNTAPTVQQARPFDASVIGSSDVVFSWRSNTVGTATIHVSEVGSTTVETHTLTANPVDPTYYSTSVNLLATGNYEWWGEFDNGCQTLAIASQTFEYTEEILFVNRSYAYTISDDYDVQYDVNDNPLSVTVRNDSTETRRITVSLENPYDELIIGFTGAGSVDSYLTLLAGQSATLNLRVFTQETQQADYAITLNLTSPDTAATDSVPLTISVQPSASFDVAITDAVVDTRNLVTEAVLVNNGSTLTDLSLQVIDADTGLPADFVLLPDINHAYILAGQSVPIEIIPLSILDNAIPGNFVIRATSRQGVIADVPITNASLANYDLTQVCTVDRPIAETCTSAPGSITFQSGGWYCTNKPNIDITIPWTLNSEVPITSIQAGMNFAPSGGAYSHSTELFFNNVSIGGGIVPDTANFNFSVPTNAVIAGANFQTLNLRSLHTNGGHYTVGSDAFITVNYGQYERTACYSESELLDAEIFPCGDQGDCQADITASQLRVERSGNDLSLTVRIGNGGTVFVNDNVQVSFYDGNPAGGGNLITTTSISQALNPGEFEDIVVTLPIASTNALPLYIVADDSGNLVGSYPESDEQNNIYNTGVYLSPDLSVNTVNVNGVTVDENSLVANGIISAQITSDVQISASFDVIFFEDLNLDGVYDAGDNTLAITNQSGIVAGVPTFVTAILSDVLQFSNSPIYAVVDGNDSIIETDESNNVGSSVSCIFADACETALPDITASYLRRSDNGSIVTLTVRIGNGGGDSIPAGVVVAFYDDDPANGGVQLQTVNTTQALDMGEFEDVSVDVALSVDAMPIWVVVDDTEIHAELDELNNVYRSNIYVTDDPNTAPVVQVDPDLTIVEGQDVFNGQFVLDATVSDDGLPVGLLTSLWEVVGGDDSVSFNPIDNVDTVVTFTQEGVYTLRLTATDGDLSAYDEIVVTYQVPPPPPLPNHTLDIDACIASPSHADSVRGLVNIVVNGTTNLENAAVYYWAARDPQAYQSIATGLTVTGGQMVAVFDTTVLANDTYGIQLVGTNPSTQEEVVCGLGLYVTGEYKPGRVVLSTTDFTVPLAGLPITVGRTYDSLERDIHSDFGYGWSLALGNPRLEIDDSNNITLTLPSGERKTFYWAPIPYPIGGFVAPNYQSEIGEYGSVSTNGCALITSGICFPGPYYRDDVSEITYSDPYGREFTYGTDGTLQSIRDLNDNLLEFESDGIYNRAINGEDPIVDIIRDPDNGNRIIEMIDFDNNSYLYNYDANGDLVSVILPDTASVTAPTIAYQYYTEAEGLAHFFKGGTDPRNNPVITTTYDSDGRLERVIDGEGNETEYQYDVPNGITTVINPDDTVMSMTYDDWGNLTVETDEIGRETNYNYDPNSNNLLSVTNHANETTSYAYDAQGNRTSVINANGIPVISASYNQYGAPETLVDANGVARNITYNANGMPSTASDPLGTIGSYAWNAQGSPEYICDATVDTSNDACGVNGNFTTYYIYDEYGNVKEQHTRTEDGINITTFDYDDMGRRTLATSHGDESSTHTEYDALGNVIRVETHDSEGDVQSRMSYTYDANGNRLTATAHANPTVDDELVDRTTKYEYDANNRVTRVINPDDSYSDSTYDWRGNVIVQATYADIDNLTINPDPTPLNQTCYDYNEAGELTDVTVNCLGGNAPASFVPLTTHYEYDAAGRRTHTFEDWTYLSATNGEGILVSYVEYDDAGRVERTVDAAAMGDQGVVDWSTTADIDLDEDVIATRYNYDDAGQLISVTDELGRTTEYIYDQRGRRTRTIYPDGTSTSTQYDLLGRVSIQTDQLGIITEFTYDVAGNLVEQTRALETDVAQTTTYVYDVLGRRTEMSTNNDTEVTRYKYDDLGRMIAMCDPSISENDCDNEIYTSEYEYNLFGQQISVTDARGNQTDYQYDEMGRPTQITYADNSVETISYNSRGQRISMSYAGYQTAYFYDDMGRLQGMCDAERMAGMSTCNSNFTTEYSYDHRGRQESMTNENGIVSRMVYDTSNRLVLQIANYQAGTYADPIDWTFQSGQWVDAEIGGTAISHGTLNNDINIITQYEYDVIGRRTLVRDVNGNETEYDYLENTNRLESTTNADGTSVSYSYDDLGRRTAMTDANGISTNYSYDPLGRLIDVSNGEGETVSYSYDPVGRVTSITNGRENVVRTFGYDLRGQLAYECDALNANSCTAPNAEITYGYDANGNMLNEEWSDGTRNEFEYDQMNRLIHEIYGAGSLDEFQYGYDYDDRGLLTGVYDGDPDATSPAPNLLTTYSYDDNGRPTDVVNTDPTTSQTQSIHYGYNALGNRTYMETSINNGAGDLVQTNVTYGYDDLNRVQSVTDTIGTAVTTEFDYNALGQMTSISRPNHVTTNYTYGDTNVDLGSNRSENPYQVYEIEHEYTDPQSQVTSLLGRYDYGYDAVGNRDAMTITAPDGQGGTSSIDYSYTYDDAYRLETESYDTGVGDVTTTYQYDRSGNRTRMTSPTGEITRYTYDANDQLTRVDLPDNLHYEKYTYDDRGNLVETGVWAAGVIDVPVGNPMLYEYNARNQLTRVELPTTERIDYEYDHNSLRTQQSVVGLQNPTLYLWDEFSNYGDVILETGANFSDDSYYRKMDYVLTGGMLVSQTNFAGDTQYFLSDAQGTTRAISDDLGVVTSEYQYDAFGNLDDTIDPFTSETTYLYTGQQFDPYTELYSLRARYYDPTHGRFLTRDTWAYNYSNPFELNRYAYGSNNPATYFDPSGHFGITGYSKTTSTVGAAAPGPLTMLNYYITTAYVKTSLFLGSIPFAACFGVELGFDFILGWEVPLTDFGCGDMPTGGGQTLGQKILDWLDNLPSSKTKEFREQMMETLSSISFPSFRWNNNSGSGASNTDVDAPSGSNRGGTNNNGGGDPNNPNNNRNRGDGDPDETGNSGNRRSDSGINSGGAGCPNSFSADTPVETPDGDVPISEIEIGDTVIAYDEETGATGEYQVTDTISHEDESVAYVTINGEEIETTPWHLFLSSNGWVEVEDLQEDDAIVSLGGVYGTVDSVIIENTVQTMYDLTVEDVHNFAVGEGDWVVHNCWRPGDPLDGPLDDGTPLDSLAADSAWTEVRERFWSTEGAFRPSEYGPRNVHRMTQLGLAPQRQVEVRNNRTGAIETIWESLEIHHMSGRGNWPQDNLLVDIDNLLPSWPTEHSSLDPNRHPGYEVIRIITSAFDN